jgi:uncharacterized membrane protein
MKDKRIGISDGRMDTIIGNLLRIAVTISALFVIVGAVFYLWHHGMDKPNYSVFAGVPKNLDHMDKIIEEAWRIKSLGIMQLGLLLLIFTPVARVAYSVIAFLIQRDYMYVVFTLIVLTILLLSITGVVM